MTIFDLFDEEKRFASGIRVPGVQREYVQGRKDASGEKAQKEFLPQLVDSAKCADANGHNKNLHFIYGITNHEDGFFMPLDGQQRLTTLFLLAWCNGDVSQKWRFEYESRRAATVFLKELAANSRSDSNVPIVEQICSSDWFMPIWEKDETVSGMLAMLRAIDELPPARQVKRGTLDLHRITFEVKKLDVEDVSYGQIFLKMNARGKPLTPWENIKAILDANLNSDIEKQCGFATSNAAGVNYKEGWKRQIDGEWCEGLWKICDKNIDKLNMAYDRVVRVAFTCVSGKEINVPAYEISKWLKDDCTVEKKVALYDSISAGLSILSGQCELLQSYWCVSRKKNGLWGGTGHDDALLKWVFDPVGANENYADVLRFFFITHFIKLQHNHQRRIRVLLNLLDATHVKRNPEAGKGFYYLMAQEGHSFLLGDRELEDLVEFDEVQLADEIEKWKKCEESKVVAIEKRDVVFCGSTKFIPSELYSDANQLSGWIDKVENRIREDELSFFCEMLSHLPTNDKDFHHYVGEVHIPHKDKLEVWGSEILSRKDCAVSVAHVLAGNDPERSPLWVKHFRELSKLPDGPLSKLGKLRNYGDWMYAVKATNRTEDAVRFDRSKTDRENRLTYFDVDCFRYGPWLRQGKDNKYYQVEGEDWISKIPPTAYDKDGNPLEVNTNEG